MARRIIVIGANAAGVEAASAARKKDRTAEITLITQEKNAGYSRCGLPFVIGGQIAKFSRFDCLSTSILSNVKAEFAQRNKSHRNQH